MNKSVKIRRMNKSILSTVQGINGFLSIVREIFILFQESDRKKLDIAIKTGDFRATCKALHVDEEYFTSLLHHGAQEIAKVVKRS